jgi:hypothetical protein
LKKWPVVLYLKDRNPARALEIALLGVKTIGIVGVTWTVPGPVPERAVN